MCVAQMLKFYSVFQLYVG